MLQLVSFLQEKLCDVSVSSLFHFGVLKNISSMELVFLLKQRVCYWSNVNSTSGDGHRVYDDHSMNSWIMWCFGNQIEGCLCSHLPAQTHVRICVMTYVESCMCLCTCAARKALFFVVEQWIGGGMHMSTHPLLTTLPSGKHHFQGW